MPHFRLETNVPRSKIPDSFIHELRQVVSKILGEGKPEELCAVTIVPDQWMVHGKEEGPCGQAIFMCVGRFSPDANIALSKALCEKLEEIGIRSDRLYIQFKDVQATDVGVAGTTALHVLGPKAELLLPKK